MKILKLVSMTPLLVATLAIGANDTPSSRTLPSRQPISDRSSDRSNDRSNDRNNNDRNDRNRDRSDRDNDTDHDWGRDRQPRGRHMEDHTPFDSSLAELIEEARELADMTRGRTSSYEVKQAAQQLLNDAEDLVQALRSNSRPYQIIDRMKSAMEGLQESMRRLMGESRDGNDQVHVLVRAQIRILSGQIQKAQYFANLKMARLVNEEASDIVDAAAKQKYDCSRIVVKDFRGREMPGATAIAKGNCRREFNHAMVTLQNIEDGTESLVLAVRTDDQREVSGSLRQAQQDYQTAKSAVDAANGLTYTHFDRTFRGETMPRLGQLIDAVGDAISVRR